MNPKMEAISKLVSLTGTLAQTAIREDGRLDVELLEAAPLSTGERVLADTAISLWTGQGIIGQAVTRLDPSMYAQWVDALLTARDVDDLV